MPTFDGFKGNNGFLVTIREEETQRSKTIAKEYSTSYYHTLITC